MSLLLRTAAVRAGVFTCLLFSFTHAAAQPVVVNAAWVRTDNAILKLGLDDLSLLQTVDITGSVRAHAVDSHALTLWVTTQDARLHAFDLNGVPKFSVDLPVNIPVDGPAFLAVDTENGAVWYAVSNQLYQLNNEGNFKNALTLEGDAVGLVSDAERGVTWAATAHRLYRLGRDGSLLGTIQVPAAGGHVVNAIALSPVDGKLMVAYVKAVQAYSPEGEAGAIIELKSLDKTFSNLDTVAVDADSSLWVSGKKTLYRISPEGMKLAALDPFRRGVINQVVGSTDIAAACLVGHDGAARVEADGSIAARFYWPSPLRSIAVSVDRVPPQVQFTAPDENAVVRPQSEFELAYSDVGAGVDPASIAFVINGEEKNFDCTASESEAICKSVEPLSGTPLNIAVTVTDYAGNVSEPATRTFRLDTDGDGYTDDIDVFPDDPAEWADLDGDGIGDNSDPDRDGDGHNNNVDAFPNDPAEWSDIDGDSIGDNADPDRDGDGHLNDADVFPNDPTEWEDFDGDGIGDNSDPDRDGDEVSNEHDAFPMDPTEWSDLDGDSVGDNTDSDMDGDGVANISDTFPFDAAEWADFDGDGSGDNSDTDVDGDTVVNEEDAFPRDPAEAADLDDDGTGDNADVDRDGDGHENEADVFPDDSLDWQDTDHDGEGDNADLDIDNDGVANEEDAFPADAEESADIDGDGIGDNADTDRDGDGHDDSGDAYPSDPGRWAVPIVTIYRPQTLTTVGASPVVVTGEVNDPAAMLMVGGMHVENQGGLFTASVSLTEGFNSIAVRAIDSYGAEVTASVIVTLDTTAPDISVSAPDEGAIVYTPAITVTGLVNDIVRGTVAEDQAVVTVNGTPATVSNRSFLAENVPLAEGANVLTIEASDAVGNIETRELRVTYKPLANKKVALISGQGQRGTIREMLDEPLAVKLTDEFGEPVKDKIVVFRVTQGDGVLKAVSDVVAANAEAEAERGLLVTTDENGLAKARFKLGSRAGQGNHKVTARAVGFENEAVFHASASPQPGNKISVIVGNNQRGATHSPLPGPLVVAVTDAGGNLVAGAPVRFEITTGMDDGARFQNGNIIYETTTDTDGRASAHLTLGREAGFDSYRAVARLAGTDAQAGFTASALVAGDAGDTSITGIVLDNQDQPIEGVTLRIQGSTRQALSGVDGRFRIENVPVGPVHLVADGATANREGEWPTLGFELTPVAGAENPLPRPVYLLPLNTESSKIVGAEDVTLTMPDVPGFALEVKAGSVTFPDGSRVGRMSVTSVNANKIPNPPPNGMQPQFIVTIQPVGAVFDPPARFTLPNVDGYLPGAEVEMFSYSHTLEEFLTIGWGTVSDDGATITSNEGIGIVESGWHCGTGPDGSGCGHSCDPICEQCDGNCNCTFLPDNVKPGQQPDDCKIQLCGGTEFKDETGALKASNDNPGDCSTPFCNAETESADTQNDPGDLDQDSPNVRCEKCEDESQVADPSKNDNKCSDAVGQECYVCTDGECKKPDCDASGEKTTHEVSVSQPFEKIVHEVSNGLSKIPNINASIAPTISGSITSGEECCKDCRDSNDPVPYSEYQINGKVVIEVSATWGFDLPAPDDTSFNIANFRVVLDEMQAWAGLKVTGTGDAGSSFGYKVNECDNDPNCVEVSLNYAVGLSVALGGQLSGEFEIIERLTESKVIDWDFEAELLGEGTSGVSGKASTQVGGEGCDTSVNGCTTFNGIHLGARAGIKVKTEFVDVDYSYKTDIFEVLGPSSSCD